MGGYGAIRNGLKYHDTFGYIAGLSSAMILEKMGIADDSSPMFFEKKSFLESVFGDLSRIKDCEINPEWIAENMKKDGIPFPHMYLACGLDDPLLPPNRKFRDTMQKLGVDVTYEEGPGAHEWDFWNRYIKKVLDWLPLDSPKGSLFIALKGDNFNGNAFAAKALEAGSAYAIVDEADYVPAGDTHYILVDNSLRTLQQLANYHRRRLGTRIIGITGTNGKTTTKELISAVLSRKYNILYTQGNLNNPIGVPLTLLRLQAEHDLGIVEMGASHPGDIKELVEIAEPDYGIITNVGKGHLEGFGSFEGVIRTKGELYDYLRQKGDSTIFIHQDNPYLTKLAWGLNPISYGEQDGLYVNGHVTGNSPYLIFEWKSGKEGSLHEVHTRLIGEYNLSNALAAVTIGCFFGVEPEKIDQALNEYEPRNNRSQLKKTADNTLIIDAYNANPTSMLASISNFHNMQAGQKMLILGDMRELGKDSPEEHQKIVDYLEKCDFKDVALVGELFAATRHNYPTYPDAPALIAELQKNKPCGKTILIKGSNGIKLNTVVDYL